MIRTKTTDFTARYFFFLFMCIIYNLWYFIKAFHPIIAERWKDFIEDGMRKEREIERLLRDYLLYLKTMKFLINHSFSVTTLSFVNYPILLIILQRKQNFCNID